MPHAASRDSRSCCRRYELSLSTNGLTDLIKLRTSCALTPSRNIMVLQVGSLSNSIIRCSLEVMVIASLGAYLVSYCRDTQRYESVDRAASGQKAYTLGISLYIVVVIWLCCHDLGRLGSVVCCNDADIEPCWRVRGRPRGLTSQPYLRANWRSAPICATMVVLVGRRLVGIDPRLSPTHRRLPLPAWLIEGLPPACYSCPALP